MTDTAAAGREVEALLDRLGAADPRAAAMAEDLVRALTELYGSALARIVEIVDDTTVRRLAGDDLIGGLLVLHDLHPDDLITRVSGALDAVRPGLGAHAGDVELMGIDAAPDGVVVRLRLAGSCHGCPSSTVTVRDAIERAVRAAAPEVARLDVEGATREPALLQIQPLPTYAADGSDCPAVAAAT
jgi:Fe-S cluster biogenesis protein NfuA